MTSFVICLSPPLLSNKCLAQPALATYVITFLLFFLILGRKETVGYLFGKDIIFGLISSFLSSILIPKMTGMAEVMKVRTPT